MNNTHSAEKYNSQHDSASHAVMSPKTRRGGTTAVKGACIVTDPHAFVRESHGAE